jgi:hypothetical protein
LEGRGYPVIGARHNADFDRRFLEKLLPVFATKHWACSRADIEARRQAEISQATNFISNLFQTNPQRPGPPLLAYYVLWLLRQKLYSVRPDKDDVERRHWLAMDLCQLLEGCGVPEDLVMNSLNRLYGRRLIEALDPNAEHVSVADKVAIKESGLAHLELMLNSTVYIEQMALITGLN